MSIWDIIVPGIKTRWSQFNPGSRHWTLEVSWSAGPHKFKENFPFEPYPRMMPIKWMEFEQECIEKFILHLTRKGPE